MGSSTPIPPPVTGGTDAAARSARDDMLLLVDFKWLMSGLGFWVDMGRWRTDPAYASDCVARGSNSRYVPLQRCAQQLQARGLAK